MLINVAQYCRRRAVGRKVTERRFAVLIDVPSEFNNQSGSIRNSFVAAKLERELRNRHLISGLAEISRTCRRTSNVGIAMSSLSSSIKTETRNARGG